MVLKFGATKLVTLQRVQFVYYFRFGVERSEAERCLTFPGVSQTVRRAGTACSFPPQADVTLKHLPAEVTPQMCNPILEGHLFFKYNVYILGKTLAFESKDVHSSSAACLISEGSLSFSAELDLGWIIS